MAFRSFETDLQIFFLFPIVPGGKAVSFVTFFIEKGICGSPNTSSIDFLTKDTNKSDAGFHTTNFLLFD